MTSNLLELPLQPHGPFERKATTRSFATRGGERLRYHGADRTDDWIDVAVGQLGSERQLAGRSSDAPRPLDRRRRTRCSAPPARMAARPTPIVSGVVINSATLPTPKRRRSGQVAGPRNQAPVTTAKEATATAATGTTRAIVRRSERESRIACPAGARTNTNGTRKAGSV